MWRVGNFEGKAVQVPPPQSRGLFFDKFKEKINKRKLGFAQGGELGELVPSQMASCTMLWQRSQFNTILFTIRRPVLPHYKSLLWARAAVITF